MTDLNQVLDDIGSKHSVDLSSHKTALSKTERILQIDASGSGSNPPSSGYDYKSDMNKVIAAYDIGDKLHTAITSGTVVKCPVSIFKPLSGIMTMSGNDLRQRLRISSSSYSVQAVGAINRDYIPEMDGTASVNDVDRAFERDLITADEVGVLFAAHAALVELARRADGSYSVPNVCFDFVMKTEETIKDKTRPGFGYCFDESLEVDVYLWVVNGNGRFFSSRSPTYSINGSAFNSRCSSCESRCDARFPGAMYVGRNGASFAYPFEGPQAVAYAKYARHLRDNGSCCIHNLLDYVGRPVRWDDRT